MRFAQLTTLFAEPVPANAFVSPYLVSVIVHAVGMTLLGVHILESHRIIEQFPGGDRFTLRVVDLHSPQPKPANTPGGIAYPRLASADSGSEGRASAGSAAQATTAAQVPVLHVLPAPHLLIQPDAPKNVVLPEKTPIPLLVLWGPEKTVVKRPTPPLPQPASVAEVRPSLETPINEESVSEFKVTASPLSKSTLATTAATTSPVVVHGPEQVKKVPQTSSVSPELKPPAPARILSLSDTRVRDGAVAVPLANQGSPKSNQERTVPGVLRDSSAVNANPDAEHAAAAGTGRIAGEKPGADPRAQTSGGGGQGHTGNGTGAGPSASPGSGAASVKSATSGSQSGTTIFPSRAVGSGNGPGGSGGTVHISLPHDGQFGVVVVGSSVADQYPETASMWSGRMASTVYLRVGQRKSWIMQYALPSLIEAANPAGGRLEAPWPFEIVRPAVDPADEDSDAIVLHGFVNQQGRFEKLQVVFPPQITQAGMLLNVLNEWQFRPARLNGNGTVVEVLIIIPDQSQ